MRIFNGLKIGDIVIYGKDQQKYRIIELLQTDRGRTCKMISIVNEKVIYEVSVQDCSKVE